MTRTGPVESIETGAHPFATPDFRRLWTGGLVSLTGSQLQFVALPYFVYHRTGSATATAITAAALVLPGVLGSPLAGGLADRQDGRRLLVVANVLLAIVTSALALAARGPWWVAAVVVGVQAALATVVGPTEHVLLPRLVGPGRLATANSLNALNNSLARLIGPASGGVLYASTGMVGVALVNAATFAVAAVLVARVRSATVPVSERRVRAAGRRAWRTGWEEIQRTPVLRRVLAVVVVTAVGEGFVSALLAPYVAEVFGSSTALGVLLSSQAVGGIAGALVVGRWLPGVRLGRTLGWGCLACGALLFPQLAYPLLYPRLWPGLILIVIAGVFFAAVATAQTTLLQVLPDAALRGRVFGVVMAAGGATHLVGIGVAGPLADRVGVYVLLLDVPCYLAAGLVMLWPHRRRAED